MDLDEGQRSNQLAIQVEQNVQKWNLINESNREFQEPGNECRQQLKH